MRPLNSEEPFLRFCFNTRAMYVVRELNRTKIERIWVAGAEVMDDEERRKIRRKKIKVKLILILSPH